MEIEKRKNYKPKRREREPKMKTKDKPNNNKDKDKKIILWEVKSFPAIEINKREEEFKDV